VRRLNRRFIPCTARRTSSPQAEFARSTHNIPSNSPQPVGKWKGTRGGYRLNSSHQLSNDIKSSGKFFIDEMARHGRCFQSLGMFHTLSPLLPYLLSSIDPPGNLLFDGRQTRLCIAAYPVKPNLNHKCSQKTSLCVKRKPRPS
jgi:hypothetical protein